MESFKKWSKQFENENSPEGDLAKDITADIDFPVRAYNRVTIIRYLNNKGACDAALDVAESMLLRYKEDHTL